MAAGNTELSNIDASIAFRLLLSEKALLYLWQGLLNRVFESVVLIGPHTHVTLSPSHASSAFHHTAAPAAASVFIPSCFIPPSLPPPPYIYLYHNRGIKSLMKLNLIQLD